MGIVHEWKEKYEMKLQNGEVEMVEVDFVEEGVNFVV